MIPYNDELRRRFLEALSPKPELVTFSVFMMIRGSDGIERAYAGEITATREVIAAIEPGAHYVAPGGVYQGEIITTEKQEIRDESASKH